jgi:hypothetical protein
MIKIKKGNPVNKSIYFKYSDGTAYDLTSKTIFFTAKNKRDVTDNDDLAVIKKDITSHTHADAGESSLVLTTAQTDIALGEYKCDFKIFDSNGVNVNTCTEILKIESKVTIRTA